MNLDFPTAQVTVRIIPETAKPNPNNIRPEDLLRLLIALGLSENRATELAAAIVDWRTPVTRRPVQPFRRVLSGQTPSFLPRHASFLENEELLLIKGMTPASFIYGESPDNSRAGLRDYLWFTEAMARWMSIPPSRPPFRPLASVLTTRAPLCSAVPCSHFDTYNALSDLQKELGPLGTRLSLGGQTMFTLRATARLKQPNGKLSDLRRTVARARAVHFSGQYKK